MARSKTSTSAVILAAFALLWAPDSAWAYIGPGTGLTAIGTLLSVIGAIFFAIMGLVWYPVKRFIKFMKRKSRSSEGQN